MEDLGQWGGIEGVVEVLNGVEGRREGRIVDRVEIEDGEVGEEMKKGMLVLEEMVRVDGGGIEGMIGEV